MSVYTSPLQTKKRFHYTNVRSGNGKIVKSSVLTATIGDNPDAIESLQKHINTSAMRTYCAPVSSPMKVNRKLRSTSLTNIKLLMSRHPRYRNLSMLNSHSFKTQSKVKLPPASIIKQLSVNPVLTRPIFGHITSLANNSKDSSTATKPTKVALDAPVKKNISEDVEKPIEDISEAVSIDVAAVLKCPAEYVVPEILEIQPLYSFSLEHSIIDSYSSKATPEASAPAVGAVDDVKEEHDWMDCAQQTRMLHPTAPLLPKHLACSKRHRGAETPKPKPVKRQRLVPEEEACGDASKDVDAEECQIVVQTTVEEPQLLVSKSRGQVHAQYLIELEQLRTCIVEIKNDDKQSLEIAALKQSLAELQTTKSTEEKLSALELSVADLKSNSLAELQTTKSTEEKLSALELSVADLKSNSLAELQTTKSTEEKLSALELSVADLKSNSLTELQTTKSTEEKLSALELSVADLKSNSLTELQTTKSTEEKLSALELSVADLKSNSLTELQATKSTEEKLSALELSVAELTSNSVEIAELKQSLAEMQDDVSSQRSQLLEAIKEERPWRAEVVELKQLLQIRLDAELLEIKQSLQQMQRLLQQQQQQLETKNSCIASLKQTIDDISLQNQDHAAQSHQYQLKAIGAEQQCFYYQNKLQDEAQKNKVFHSQSDTVKQQLRLAIEQADKWHHRVTGKIDSLNAKLAAVERKRNSCQQAIRKRRQCSVCFEAPNCMVFIPCGHRCTCSACSKKLQRCCICRAKIESTVRAYDVSY